VCGIAGKVSVRGSVSRELIERMCEAQVHRGPDSRGVHLAEGVGLGIQRLRVIDLETGDQPLYNEDRSVAVVLNGEIYNFRELRSELESRGHRFSSRGDTEVIAHLYEEMGPRLCERLNGMFAFAVWDESRRSLLLARDRIGKKPLHYFVGDGALGFASELGALMADPDIPRDLDPTALDCYLAYGYVQAPRSIWRGVRKLPPAQTLVWRDGDVAMNRYWQLDYSRKVDGDPEELEEELRRRVGAAVRRRLVADVPLGALLSGGVDSSVVVSEMAAASERPVKTFSIGFPEERFNELPKARLVAERYGTEHTELIVEPNATEIAPTLARHYGEPYADSSALPTFYLAELTRRDVTVALNGDGGDESFAGYQRYVANSLTRPLELTAARPRRAVAEWARGHLTASEGGTFLSYARRFLMSCDLDRAERYAHYVKIFDQRERRDVLDAAFREQVEPGASDAVIQGPWDRASGHDRLDVLMEIDVETYLPGDLLPKVDIATMAHSLEARSPLLDHEVMEFAAALPARRKARLLEKKRILRRAYRQRVPAEILDGPKRGFGVPLAAWLRGDLRGWAHEVLLDPLTLGRGELRPYGVRRVLDDHIAGRSDRSSQIWALIMLELWRREFKA